MQNESCLSEMEIAGHHLKVCLRRNADPVSDKLLSELNSITALLNSRLKTLPEDFSHWAVSQQLSWASSRQCLVDLLRAEYGKAPHVSLSHTREVSLVAVCNNAPIGVDIEPTAREISKALFARLSSSEEREIKLSSIELWTLKEACFKADPDNLNSVLSNYQVKHYDARLGVGKIARKNTEEIFTVQIFTWQEFTYSIALLTTGSSSNSNCSRNLFS